MNTEDEINALTANIEKYNKEILKIKNNISLTLKKAEDDLQEASESRHEKMRMYQAVIREQEIPEEVIKNRIYDYLEVSEKDRGSIEYLDDLIGGHLTRSLQSILLDKNIKVINARKAVEKAEQNAMDVHHNYLEIRKPISEKENSLQYCINRLNQIKDKQKNPLLYLLSSKIENKTKNQASLLEFSKELFPE